MGFNSIGTVNSQGRYEDLGINGVYTFNGDIEAGNFKNNGVVTVNGSLKVDEAVKVNGTQTVSGGLQSKEIKINGTMTVGGNIEAGWLKINGTVTAKENIEADEIKLNGTLSCNGQISADLVNAGNGHINAKELVGETILLIPTEERKRDWNWLRRTRNRHRVEVIEATEVSIDHTKCGRVSGENVYIGADCEIDKVEYTKTFKAEKGAVIREVIGPDAQ